MEQVFDQEFQQIQDNFLANEINKNGLQDKKINALIGLVCLMAIQNKTEIQYSLI